MNKLLTKAAKLLLGLSLAAGVGVAVGSQSKASKVDADTEESASVAMSSFGWGSTSQNAHGESNAANIDSNGDIKFYTTGSSNNGKYYSDWRLYYNGSGDVNVKAYNSCTINTITFTYSVSNNGKLHSSRAQSVSSPAYSSGTAITVNSTSFRAYVAMGNTNTNGQVRITNIAVTYTKPSSDTLSTINLASSSLSTTALTSATVKTGKTLQVYLTANYSIAGATDKTEEATWTATNGTGSATVSKGLITGVSVGSVTISASYGGKSAVSLTLSVTQGPELTLSSVQVTPFHEKETKNDITISANYFTNTPTITASSSSQNLTASILGNGNLQIVAGNTISANETVDVTVTANDGVDSVSKVVKVYLKAPVFHLSGSELNLKPSTHGTLTATVEYFKDEVSITATSSNTSSFTASVSGTTITVNATATEGSGTLTVVGTDGTISRTVTADVVVADVLEYDLVSDASTLTEDSQLIIASTVSGNSYAMGAQSGTLRTSISTTVSNGTITGPSSDVKIVTLQGESGAWYLKVDDGYLTYSGSSNNISTTANKADACTWNISISSNNATISPSTATSRFISYNSSQPRFCVYANVQNNVQIYAIIAAAKTITNQRIDTVGTVSASTGDSEWTITGFTFQVQYDNGSEWVTVDNSDVTYSVNIAVPAITQNGSTTVTVTGTYGEVSASTTNVTATLTYVNPIQAIYDKANNASVDVYGYYVGFAPGTGPVIMDGEYGIVIYAKTHDVSGYTEMETILHVTGTVSIYNGLYEIANATITTASGQYTAPDTPQVYAVQGGETKYEQSRLTHVSGVVTTEGNLDGTPGNADITLTVTKSGSPISVFFKKVAQTSENMAELKAAVTSGDEITIKCFTGWYNAFQVQFVSIVEAVEGYTAEDFAQQLLDLTDAVCSNWDGHSSNKSALISVWNTLDDDEHYEALAPAEKTAFSTADPDYENDSADVVENAAGRYNMLVKKYSLTNFAGRTDVNTAPVVPAEANVLLRTIVGDNTNTVAIIVIISLVSVTAIGGYFFLKKRREQN